MSLTLWLTRSSPTVSKRPACSATRTLVPTPSVLSTSVGFRMPAGTRTIPPKAPTFPTDSEVRVPATSSPIRALAASARVEIHTGRGVLPPGSRDRLRQRDMGQIAEGARPAAPHRPSVTPSKPRMPNCSTA